jgi:hypothetical protein
MKISEVLEKLQGIKSIAGDLECLTENFHEPCRGSWEVYWEPVTEVAIDSEDRVVRIT